MANNKFNRQQIGGIGEAYRQITESKVSIGNSSSSTVSARIVGLGGADIDGKQNVLIKPNSTTSKPTGKGTKKAGYGFEVQADAFVKIAKTIKDAGIPFDENDPIEISRALNNLKGKKQQEVIDKVAKDFGLTIDREEILADVKKVFDGIAQFQELWGKKADAREKKLHDAKVKVVQDLWKNPNNRTDAAVNAVDKWRNRPMGTGAGELPGTEEAWWDPFDLWQYSPLNPNNEHIPDWFPKPIWDSESPLNPGQIPKPSWVPDWYPWFPDWFPDPTNDDGGGDKEIPGEEPPAEDPDAEPPWSDPQGAQAPGEPTGTLSPKEKRIANVKDAIETKKLEKKGLFKPNTRDKVAKKLIKDVMRSHPKKGKPAFVATKGSKIYKEIIKKYGTELENDGGEYETANAGMPGPGDIIPNPSGGGLDWGNVDPNAGRQYKIPSGGIGRRAIDPGGNLGPDSWDIDPVTGGNTTYGGNAARGVVGGMAIVVVVGGVAIWYSHKVANDPDAPENTDDFADFWSTGWNPQVSGAQPVGMPGTGWDMPE